ncbi:MAG: hypothetical protein Q7U28_09240 [Aquabacterium sp.]|nr:hypothetical protein [Aquabacterium sp.]
MTAKETFVILAVFLRLLIGIAPLVYMLIAEGDVNLLQLLGAVLWFCVLLILAVHRHTPLELARGAGSGYVDDDYNIKHKSINQYQSGTIEHLMHDSLD